LYSASDYAKHVVFPSAGGRALFVGYDDGAAGIF